MSESKDSNFLVRNKLKAMIAYGKPILTNYPKRERVLANDIQRCMHRLNRQAIAIEKAIGKANKLKTCKAFDEELESLRDLLQFSYDKDYYKSGDKVIPPPLSIQHYEVWSEKVDEIGKMIGKYMQRYM